MFFRVTWSTSSSSLFHPGVCSTCRKLQALVLVDHLQLFLNVCHHCTVVEGEGRWRRWVTFTETFLQLEVLSKSFISSHSVFRIFVDPLPAA